MPVCDESKSLAQQVLENIFKFTFTVGIVAISIVGTIATLGTMHKGLVQFLSLIPAANVLAVQVAAGVIAFGLLAAARLPWVLQSVCGIFSWLGEKMGNYIYLKGQKSALNGVIEAPVAEPIIPLADNEEIIQLETMKPRHFNFENDGCYHSWS